MATATEALQPRLVVIKNVRPLVLWRQVCNDRPGRRLSNKSLLGGVGLARKALDASNQ